MYYYIRTAASASERQRQRQRHYYYAPYYERVMLPAAPDYFISFLFSSFLPPFRRKRASAPAPPRCHYERVIMMIESKVSAIFIFTMPMAPLF